MTSGGVRGLDATEEFVLVSQQPDEQRDEMSPSLAMSREDDLEDFPEEPPRDEPPPEGALGPILLLGRRGAVTRPPVAGRLPGLGGDAFAKDPALLKGGDVLTDPSGCCTLSRTSLHFFGGPILVGPRFKSSGTACVTVGHEPCAAIRPSQLAKGME